MIGLIVFAIGCLFGLCGAWFSLPIELTPIMWLLLIMGMILMAYGV